MHGENLKLIHVNLAILVINREYRSIIQHY